MSAKATVLIAEDDADQIYLLNRAFQRVDFDFPCHFVEDGQEAMDYFDGLGKYSDRKIFPLPVVAIFDINMPRVNGFEALEWLRNHKDHGETPVLMLSSSSLEQDMQRARELKATHYLVKSLHLERMGNEIKRFVLFYATSSRRD